jgi:hypothetical protein
MTIIQVASTVFCKKRRQDFSYKKTDQASLFNFLYFIGLTPNFRLNALEK